MTPSTKVGVAVAGGYLLGRTKKARLAIALGSWLLGKKLDPKALGKEAFQQLSQRPEFSKLTGDMRGELLNVGKAAAVAAMNSRIERLASSLDSRTSQLRDQLELGSGIIDGESEDGVEDEYDDDEGDDTEDEGTEDEDTEETEDEEPERPRRDSRHRTGERPQRRGERDQGRSGRRDRPASHGGEKAQRTPSKGSRGTSGSRSAGRKSAPAKRTGQKAGARQTAGASSSRHSA